MTTPEAVLEFWFPTGLAQNEHAHREQMLWWFGGGSDPEILRRFVPALEAAIHGELDHWRATPRGRLALVLVLDQFSRTVHRGTPRAYAQDGKAQELVLEGLANGDYQRLGSVWEKTFMLVVLGHSEQMALQQRCVALAAALVDEAPPFLRPLYAHSLSQARGHCDVIGRFGRHPHRNRLLGRCSTPEELEYLRAETPVHQRRPPEP